MNEGAFVFFDGSFRPSGQPLISANNRSFRYGDGFFETMHIVNGSIALQDLHMQRLYKAAEALQFRMPSHFSADALAGQALALAEKNGHHLRARVRLTLFRGEGGLFDEDTSPCHWLIQTWQMPAAAGLNTNGLDIGVFPDARKACDSYANLKNNNYLPYVMAARWARQHQLNDALVLNAFGRIADASIANVFLADGENIKTPALSEGCVGGVMRRFLIDSLRAQGTEVTETMIPPGDLLKASEIFLTNAITGIRWVKQLNGKQFSNPVSSRLYRELIAPLFQTEKA